MKRIIGLILVAVMLTLSLASCGYSFVEDKNLSQYASFNKEDFASALYSITIKDADFTEDEDTRNEKVIDSIYTALAKKANKNNKLKEGVVGDHDKVFYCYYATAEITKDGKTENVIVYAANMQESKATEAQMGLNSNSELVKLIEDQIKATGDLKDKVYSTKSEGSISTEIAGKLAFVTYTKEVKPAEGDTTTTSTKVAYTNQPTILNDSDELGNLIIAHLEKIKSDEDTKKDTETLTIAFPDLVTADGLTTYTGVKINWVVEKGATVTGGVAAAPITFADTTYDETTNVTATTGKPYDLKNVKLTYNVFPVYYLDVEDYDAKAVLRTLITSMTKDSLECFENVEGIEEIITAFNEKLTAYNTAKTAYDSAVTAEETALKTLNDAKTAGGATPTEAQQDTINKAQQKYDAAVNTKNTAKADMDSAATALDTAEAAITAKVAPEVIVEAYTKSQYDALLEEYKSEIKNLIATEIWELMQAKTTVNGAPEDAVEEIYDHLMEQYKYTFNESKYPSSTESYYKHYSGNFEAFLIDQTKVTSKTYEDAKHKVWADALAHVKTMVVVYVVADAYNLLLTEDQIDAYKDDVENNYEAYGEYYGELNFVTAYQFDVVLDYFLTYDENLAEVDGNDGYPYIDYKIEAPEEK